MVVLSTAKTLALTASVLMGAIQDCNDAKDLDRQIAGCSLYISSGEAEGENLVTAYVNRAIALSNGQQHEKALADFAAALKIEPESWIVFYNRGIVYFDLGRDDDAIADFGAAIEADPTTAIAYYNRGLAYERSGRIAEAVEDYRRAVALDPTDGNAKAHLDNLAGPRQG